MGQKGQEECHGRASGGQLCKKLRRKEGVNLLFLFLWWLGWLAEMEKDEQADQSDSAAGTVQLDLV